MLSTLAIVAAFIGLVLLILVLVGLIAKAILVPAILLLVIGAVVYFVLAHRGTRTRL